MNMFAAAGGKNERISSTCRRMW